MIALLAASAYLTTLGLVLVRLSTIMVSGAWWFGQAAIPTQAKFGLAFCLALLVTPTLGTIVPPPSTMLDLAWLVVGEAVVGGTAGLVVGAVLSGLQLAGDLIDQQAGIALGEVFNPATGDSMTVTGTFLIAVSTAALLAAEPFGLEERLLGGVLDSFRTLPPGSMVMPSLGPVGSGGLTDVLAALVQQAAVLAIRVAAPLMAVMAIVSLTLGTLGATVPQVNVLVLGFAVRASVALAIIGLSLSPMMDVTLQTAFETVDTALGIIQTMAPVGG